MEEQDNFSDLIGVAMEAGLKCPACDGFVPLNRLADSVVCPACRKRLGLPMEVWHTILDDSLKEAVSFKEDEGMNRTIFSSFNIKLTFGRQFPRYNGTKISIDPEELMDSLEKGVITGPEKGGTTSVRALPPLYSKEFPGVVVLVGETAEESRDEGETGSDHAKLSGPVAFQCPSCGASLLLDGSNRTVECKFCNSSVYLPDDLWNTIHPVKGKNRWYLVLDPGRMKVEWERELWDAVQDSEGNFYLLCEPGFMGKELVLLKTSSKRKLIWRRSDLQLKHTTSRGEPRMGITSHGSLLLASGDAPQLYEMDASDGKLIRIIDAPESPNYELHRFSMEGCYDFGVFPDDSLLLYRNLNRQVTGAYVMEFQKFDMQGNFLPLWPEEKRKKAGFFQRMKDRFQARRGPTELDSTGDFPVATREFDLRLSVGRDGSVSMLDFRTLLKLSPEGRKVYLIQLPCNYTTGRPLLGRDGEAYVVANQNDDVVEILRISPDGKVMTSIARAGNSGTLTMSPEGELSILGYSGYWESFQTEA